MTVVGNSDVTTPMSLIGVVMPVAMYFLIIGLLNSRSRPQLLSRAEDSLLLLGSLSLLFLPALTRMLGMGGALTVAALAAAMAMGGLMFSRPRAWVIYNLTAGRAEQLLPEVLAALGLSYRREGRSFVLGQGRGRLEIRVFSLLRNVSVRLQGGSKDLARGVEAALAGRLSDIPSEPNPAATALLLTATVLLIAPLTLMAHRAGEIVRILTDLLQ